MVGQRIGLPHLVPLALQRLRDNPLANRDFFPGDLLANVLRIDAEFWCEHPDLARFLAQVLDDLRGRPAGHASRN
jgi:hypothetical protein